MHNVNGRDLCEHLCMKESHSAARRYLLHVLTSLDMPAARLADMAHLAPTTLTRFLNDADHKFNLSTTTLEKIRDATSIPFAPFLDADDIASTVIQREIYLNDPRAYQKSKFFEVPVIGEVQPGVWREEESFLNIFVKRATWTGLNVASAFWNKREQFAVEVKGSSTDRFAADGDYLLCVTLNEYVATYGWLNNGLVIVERSSADGGTLELTSRYLKRRETSATLVFASTDSKYSEKLTIADPLAADRPIRIIGVVDCVVRRPLQGLRFTDLDAG